MINGEEGNHSYPANASGFTLEPGHIYFTREIDVIRAVVGSCVCVCLWDRKLKYGGMNHYIRGSSKGRQSTAEHGDAATLHLLRLFMEAGSESSNIVAQIFGAAVPEDKTAFRNSEKVEAAKTVLRKRGIKVLSEDTGGSMGRKILFDTSSGEVAVLKVFRLRSEDWYD